MGVENGRELAKDMKAQKVTTVNYTYVVILMASLFETVGFKLAEGKGLLEGWDSKEMWKSVEKLKVPLFTKRERK